MRRGLFLPALFALAGACSREPPAAAPGTPTSAAVSASAPATTAPVTSAAPSTPSASAGATASAAPAASEAPLPATWERTPDIEFVPTPQNVVDKMLEAAKLGKDDLLYDLGCGDGRIVVTAAKKYGVKAVGFDIDPQRVREARENVRKAGVENLARIELKDIFKVDVSPANVVTLYLLPDLNVKLIPQLDKLAPGSRIVSHDFDMAGVTPDGTWALMAPHHRPPHKDRAHYVYLWKTPLKKAAAGKKTD